MTDKHPMADVFIQKIQVIVASIFKKEQAYADFQRILEDHLERAQKLNAVYYETNVWNALYINNEVFHPEDFITSDKYLKSAYEAALKTGDPALKVRISNNIAAFNRGRFNHEEASSYLDVVITEGRNLQPPSQVVLFAYGMRIDDALLAGDFATALDVVGAALAYAHTLEISGESRNNFARGIYFVRINEVRANLGAGNDEEALSINKIAYELNEQLKIPINFETIKCNQALYDLMASGDEVSYNEWWQRTVTEKSIDLATLGSYAFILHYRGFTEQAQAIRAEIIARANAEIAEPVVRDRIQNLLQPITTP